MNKELNKHGGDIYDYNEGIIDFSSNINPLGLSESVKQAIVAHIDEYSRYPDPECRELREALGRFHNLPADYFICGNGAADLIYRAVLARKPKKALITAPTFSEYELALNLVNCEVDYYVLQESKEFAPDEAILEQITADLDMIFLCSPNNPTGVVFPAPLLRAIVELCDKYNILLIMDECFLDFVTLPDKPTALDYIDSPNVLVLKAFTKFFAMAGLRLGYIVSSNEKLLSEMTETLQPWSVSTVAIKCGVAALADTAYIADTIAYMDNARKKFITELQNIDGITLYNSAANYLLFKSIPGLKERLVSKKILIRSCANYHGLSDSFYRIAVKRIEDNDYFIKQLKEVLANG